MLADYVPSRYGGKPEGGWGNVVFVLSWQKARDDVGIASRRDGVDIAM